MSNIQAIELLAPARNLECGMAAISHGADAVYIGAAHFGARAAAGNTVDDIAQLCAYAHQYGAKVYVTVNTIVFDDELAAVRQLISRLADVGVDAILVQDMGLVNLLNTPHQLTSLRSHLSIHASTQTDNRTVEKVRWLRSLGFRRVVLARELSIEEIRKIHQSVPDVELEVFVHGALCVSYSGLCYASHYCFGRSANRGSCSQFCRLKFDLQDADGEVIEKGRHLLSLKDLCQIDVLEDLIEAGACSLKVEGRLKDVAYVKNVVAAYSQQLNSIISRHPDKYRRASLGRSTYSFEPNLQKTFNRGFTHYFLHGRQNDIASFDTPKAIGEYVGRVKEIRGGSFTVAGTAHFANGDGLCFFYSDNPKGKGSGTSSLELEGFRVNKVENNRLFPLVMPRHLRQGMSLYRNNDQEFERLLSKNSAERKIEVDMTLKATTDGFRLTMSDPAGHEISSVVVDFPHQNAQKPQRQNILTQLSKLGGTPYSCRYVNIEDDSDRYFIPSSVLSDMRRRVTSPATPVYCSSNNETTMEAAPLPRPEEYCSYPYLYNIANEQARAFYLHHGLPNQTPAFELLSPTQRQSPLLLMQCRHCLRYSLGFCVRHGGRRPLWREPLFLVLSDGKRFRLQFDCQQCQMNVYDQ